MTAGKRVLVVEDDPDTAESMALLIGLWGHNVTCAADGPSALIAAIRYKPSVALIDIGLPGMDGYRLASQLRTTQEGEQMTLVAVTGFAGEDYQHRAAEAGFDVFAIKPILPEKLQSLLDSPELPRASLGLLVVAA